MEKAEKILKETIGLKEKITYKDYGYNITVGEAIKAINKALSIAVVSNCGDKHLSKICDKQGHQMAELWYVNEDKIPFQLEHQDKCCICGYESNDI